MTSVFDDTAANGTGRADPSMPVTLTPRAAADGDTAEQPGGGLDLSVFFSIDAQLGSLAAGLASDRQRRDSMEPPSNPPLFRAGVVPASGLLTLDLGSVPQGFVWQVRRIIVGGVKVTTTAAGKAYAFASGGAPADLALTDCVDIFAALPALNKYGTHQLFLLAGEHLFVAFVGATPTQQYVASARVEQWDDAIFRSTFAE